MSLQRYDGSLRHITKLWKLLELSLADLETLEKDSRFVIRMSAWHTPYCLDYGHRCEICLAGSVMQNTLGVPLTEVGDPDDFDEETSARLYAINALRGGDIMQAYLHLHLQSDIDMDNMPLTVRAAIGQGHPVTPYECNVKQFKADLAGLLHKLKAVDI